jgi:hypothetical protein
MTRILYLDPFSGISGDMFLAAMVDAGVDVAALRSGLAALGIEGLEVSASRVRKAGIGATLVQVAAPDTAEERHLSEIVAVIDGSGLPAGVRKTARAVFRRLAAAESRVHGMPVEEVHFHEVGALDTIADVVGAAICLSEAGIEEVYSAPVNVGGGTVRTAHGLLPVPAPATLELLKNVPIYSSGAQAELTTPTGAAVLAEVCREFGPMPHMRVEATGYGAGSKELETPNVLRVAIGELLRK